MTDLDPAASMFAPASIEEIESRLADIKDYSCDCGDSLHENALHDLATDDVPWLIDILRAAHSESDRLTAALAEAREREQRVRAVAFDPDTISALERGAIWNGFDGPEGLTKDEALSYAVDALRDIRAVLDGAT